MSNYSFNNYFLISENETIAKALRFMRKNGQKCLIIVNSLGLLKGSLSDGDIRNFLIKENNLKSTLSKIYNKKPIYLSIKNFNKKKLFDLFNKYQISLIPLVDNTKKVLHIFTKNDSTSNWSFNPFIIPVLIMAGGQGLRLKPFTDVLPKPLIPINGIPILQIIINKFSNNIGSPIFISLNYKDKIMKAYLNDFKDKYNLSYINEKKPLGTVGAAKFVPKNNNDNLIITNCDIFIEYDYKKIIKFHIKNNYNITIVGVKKIHKIPYGVIKTRNNKLSSLDEKPLIDFTINGGFYIIKRDIIDKIPKNKKYDLTDLINLALKSKSKIGVYKIDAEKWHDIGQWNEYKETVTKLNK